MAPVKAAAPPRARSTILHSRPPKPMPPNGRSPPSASRLGLSFIGKAARPCTADPSRSQRQALSHQRGLAFIPTIRRLIPRPSRYYGRRQSPPITEHFKERCTTCQTRRLRRLRRLRRQYRSRPRPRSTKAFSRWPNPSAAATNRICALWLHNHVIVCGRHPSDPHHLRFAQPRALGVKVSDEFTVPLCRGHHRQLHQAGNEITWWKHSQASTPCPLLGSFGSKRIPMKARPRRKLQVLDSTDAKIER